MKLLMTSLEKSDSYIRITFFQFYAMCKNKKRDIIDIVIDGGP